MMAIATPLAMTTIATAIAPLCVVLYDGSANRYDKFVGSGRLRRVAHVHHGSKRRLHTTMAACQGGRIGRALQWPRRRRPRAVR